MCTIVYYPSSFLFNVDLTKIKIQASPITIGDRQAVVEEKRTTTRGKFKLLSFFTAWSKLVWQYKVNVLSENWGCCYFLQLAAVGEGDFLREEVGSGVTVSRAVGTLVAAGVMAGVNSETRVSFQGDPGVQVDAMERVISGLTRMAVGGVGVKVEWTVAPLLLEHWRKWLTVDFLTVKWGVLRL
jgi:hypothetical protein